VWPNKIEVTAAKAVGGKMRETEHTKAEPTRTWEGSHFYFMDCKKYHTIRSKTSGIAR
jgi:hypothetical protein